ncbi:MULTISPECIES: 2-polyprenyl-3-methyl-6-methoxy-1,4-benzoquinone monooxygenase [unclassified Neisseria]|uniref:2-polyprenyl-3-methyl-6-methoxy-1,4-benzoquinone monooxygenase n=1 Tax=unclassified Neisseria TaxID=2623750 RepID=UPI0026671D6B|nr:MULTISPECIES: 2-polyprenyl-3-methyl-6-methoxy-1,4-benzoquinone monooxygenase [unclassified Neisseria]MDO1509306.1 2-polyprenyl-3-methyl-6-methoxy-1,4-benzoquinone monooxygenase [Neisseria sp. MVDL19-042950]MDO1515415.1 2-polyprenyl-3-methyl-6-methoxy-1,4-benzoquinone monooxygenase [Neisseria sp. MVDL18-041461]MDO1562775.1 2-polyprenyl-3-methyl-6-methoxy-1,4-benzoquinone monooxygenase [Neisseria sp. MVDL20-010259]
MLAKKLIPHIDTVLRTLFAPATTGRPYPDAGLEEGELSEAEKRHALGLMRVNHVGEVCAQALYQGQALTARDKSNREALQYAAYEEVEHLAWTEKRVKELGGRTSLLNPVWYAGSLLIGLGAGLLGDKWNLGFLEETENQVTAHLEEHLEGLPEKDAKSRAIVAQMRLDEMQHADMARNFGAAPLPLPVKEMMKLTSKIMTTISYRI